MGRSTAGALQNWRCHTASICSGVSASLTSYLTAPPALGTTGGAAEGRREGDGEGEGEEGEEDDDDDDDDDERDLARGEGRLNGPGVPPPVLSQLVPTAGAPSAGASALNLASRRWAPAPLAAQEAEAAAGESPAHPAGRSAPEARPWCCADRLW